MQIKIIKESISRKEIVDMSKKQFGDLVKVVVDIKGAGYEPESI